MENKKSSPTLGSYDNTEIIMYTEIIWEKKKEHTKIPDGIIKILFIRFLFIQSFIFSICNRKEMDIFLLSFSQAWLSKKISHLFCSVFILNDSVPY